MMFKIKKYCFSNKIVMVLTSMVTCVLLTVTGCKYDKEELLNPPGNPNPDICTTTPASFSADILPLITNNCAVPGCHDASASGGLVLQNYAQISGVKDRINVRVIVQQSMPPIGPLPTADINKLSCWIAAGGLNN